MSACAAQLRHFALVLHACDRHQTCCTPCSCLHYDAPFLEMCNSNAWRVHHGANGLWHMRPAALASLCDANGSSACNRLPACCTHTPPVWLHSAPVICSATRFSVSCNCHLIPDWNNQHSPTQDERKGHAVAPCDILACCHPNNRLDNTDLASVRSPKYGRGVCNVNPVPKATSLLLCSSSHCIQ